MDPEVRKLHKRAEFLMAAVRKYLSDDDFDEERRKELFWTISQESLFL